MTAKELYEEETGNKCPSNQIAYSEWHIEFVQWLERRVEDQSINNWVSCSEKLPEALETVWLTNDKGWVALGCLVEDYRESGYYYHWAEGNGVVYTEDGKIVSECESDDLNVTHWCKLPKLI